jgi:hypothetical protein
MSEIQIACALFAAPSLIVGSIFVVGSYFFGSH